jgi:hypothetical protein
MRTVRHWLNFLSRKSLKEALAMQYRVLFLPILALLLGMACSMTFEEENISPQQNLPPVSQNESVLDSSIDIPKYSLTEVLSIAKELSPDCQIKVGVNVKNTSTG